MLYCVRCEERQDVWITRECIVHDYNLNPKTIQRSYRMFGVVSLFMLSFSSVVSFHNWPWIVGVADIRDHVGWILERLSGVHLKNLTGDINEEGC